MSNSDRSWKYWGSKDPYYGVLTSEGYKKENLDAQAKQLFFNSGEKHIHSRLSFIHQHIDSNFKIQNAVDFGCGTGRLVIPLAKLSDEVVGIDVSEKMLEEAKRNCEEKSIHNVKLVISDDDLTLLEGSYNFIHSFIVFQHIPTVRGGKIIQNLISHLSPGGVGVLHVTYHRDASKLRKIVHWLRANFPLVHNLVNLAQKKNMFEPMMQMNQYSLNHLFAMFQHHGIKKVFSEFTEQEGHCGLIMYVLN